MSLKELGVTYKKSDEILVAGLRFRGSREDIGPKLEELRQQCEAAIDGKPLAVYRFDTGKEGLDIEVCYPVTRAVETDEVKSRRLPSIEVLSILHHGTLEKRQESFEKLRGAFREHGLCGDNELREIYLETDPDDPDRNVTEIQVKVHTWSQLFAENLDRAVGSEIRGQVMQGVEALSPDSSLDERVTWIQGAIGRLDTLAGEEQKCQVLSGCAHTFAPERIAQLKVVYEKNKDVDEVLAFMSNDPDWYESPRREGNVIYVTKIPFNPEGYEQASDPNEKRQHYCHCPIAKAAMDAMSPTFCYCGAGWYTQQWEGILGQPVRIERVQSLVDGSMTCQFAIHLPLELD